MIPPSEKSVGPIYEGNLHIRGGCGSSVNFLDVAAEISGRRVVFTADRDQDFGVSCAGGQIIGTGSKQANGVLVDRVERLVAACPDDVVVQVSLYVC